MKPEFFLVWVNDFPGGEQTINVFLTIQRFQLKREIKTNSSAS